MAEKMTACSHCDNTGWVCEEHPDRAWTKCNCGGASLPWPICNYSAGPERPTYRA
jgi:hypothetical protein